MNLREIIRKEVLPLVTSPGQYIGNELNTITTPPKEAFVSFALAFPDTYSVGMSHLGSKILYSIINNEKELLCERVFAPWTDAEEILRKKNIPLWSWETAKPVKTFDIVGFSIQHELCYTNILNMLELSQIPLWANERNMFDYPLIIGGGPLALSPEPLAGFIDLFVIGDGEETILKLLKFYQKYNKKEKTSKKEFLTKISQEIEGIYAPSLYELNTKPEKRLSYLTPKTADVPKRIKRPIYDINKFTLKDYPVPFVKIIHDRVILEIMRGCSQGCRFCQAGMLYRPVREKSIENILKEAEILLSKTGYDEVSLSSLSTTDHSQINQLIATLYQKYHQDKISISLPSTRADKMSPDILAIIKKIKKNRNYHSS